MVYIYIYEKESSSDTNFEMGKPCQHFDGMLLSSSGQSEGIVF